MESIAESNCPRWHHFSSKSRRIHPCRTVKVNGQVVGELGIKVGKHDTVEVDEVPPYQEEYGYYLLYKPKGVISAVADDKGRKSCYGSFADGKRTYLSCRSTGLRYFGDLATDK